MSHLSMSDGALKIQSATEYLLTYGWAFLIAAVVIAALYLFVFAPTSLSPSSCTFSSGAYCQDMILGSSATLSKIAMLLTNTNPYPIINPSITVNVSGAGLTQGNCIPNFVLPGGAIICNATIIPAVAQSALTSGKFIFSYTPCPGGNATVCSSNARQNYLGSFSTHASPLLSPTTLSVTLSVQNTSQVALSATLDKLTANVKLLGTPVSGATVNFTSNSINAKVNPSVTTTDGSGNAFSYTSSNTTGTVFYTAYYANTIANVTVTFTPPVCYTISVPSLSGASSNVIVIDGVGYSSFPQQLCFGQGTTHSYSFQSTVTGGAGTQFIFNSASGCGASSQSGTLSGASNCTLVGNYITQYYLTTAASPVSGGTVTPLSGWYNSGSSATLGETPSAGYAFNGWTGSGSGSYSGSNTAPLVVLNNPISETGSFTSTSTSTTSTTTSTSTTTTAFPIISNPTSGNYSGDIVYSVSTTLTGSVIGINMITINPGVTVNECSHYLQGNTEIINRGTLTDTCSGGSGGGTGGSGSAGSSRTSKYFARTLTAGHGGAGGGGGGGGGSGNSGGCTGCVNNGGSGGAGGGIVEIYSNVINNQGTITVAGFVGQAGGAGGFCACNCPSGTSGAGGGGGGGSGGTIMIGYATSVTFGTLLISSGTPGSGGPGGSGSGGGCCTSSGGGGASGSGTSGGSGGSGGATFDARCSSGPGPGGGGSGGTGYSPASGTTIEISGWTP